MNKQIKDSWCRQRDCKHHPTKKLFFGVRRRLRCLSCRHFAPKDFYKV